MSFLRSLVRWPNAQIAVCVLGGIAAVALHVTGVDARLTACAKHPNGHRTLAALLHPAAKPVAGAANDQTPSKGYP